MHEALEDNMSNVHNELSYADVVQCLNEEAVEINTRTEERHADAETRPARIRRRTASTIQRKKETYNSKCSFELFKNVIF